MSFNDIINGNIETLSGGSSNNENKPPVVIDEKICIDEKKQNCNQVITSTKPGKSEKKQKSSESKELSENVNVVIKSCKNITTKQQLLIIPITKFFSDRKILNRLIKILKGESISLRLIDWFVTNYCKKYPKLYNVNEYNEKDSKNEKESTINNETTTSTVSSTTPTISTTTKSKAQTFDDFIMVHTNYKGQLKAYSKRNFDPFCRRNRIRFYYDDTSYFITTVGQLNFFKWAFENHIIDIIQKNIKEIDDDMNQRCETIKKGGTKINTNTGANAMEEIGTKKNRQEGVVPIETTTKTKKGGTRKKRTEISTSASKSLSFHNFPTTLSFD